MIRIQDLVFKYEKQLPLILDIPDLIIKEGEYTALIGPNGCGKTTLIRHFNALLLPSAGGVWIDDLNTRDKGNLAEIRRRVGMIFQNPDNQIVGMSVEEDVAFGPGNLGLPPAEIRCRVKQALETVGLTGYETHPPYTLSGGQKQLLALAGILAMNPRFIILDEPTSSLDPAAKKNVITLLQNLKKKGIGIVHITHSMDEASLADRVLVMDHGELIADGRPEAILSRAEWLRSLGLEPTQITELMWQLHQRGETVATNIISMDAAVDEIIILMNELRASNNHGRAGKAVRYV
ncbi:MAG TPA: energy-coupling factor transporter ATPase [Syntrophomonadaceae bacterium]|nr:energy-coupling factor transporter ATPase [Syntrophomonadaceae bacterium]